MTLSREIRRDFDDLISFFRTYSIDESLSNNAFEQSVSMIHKRHYSFMCLIYCLSNGGCLDDKVSDRLKESSSDLNSMPY